VRVVERKTEIRRREDQMSTIVTIRTGAEAESFDASGQDRNEIEREANMMAAACRQGKGPHQTVEVEIHEDGRLVFEVEAAR
jgi:hypothetical protein